MPVEIKELIIRAVVEEDWPGAEEVPTTSKTVDDKQVMIEACVKQVLRLLKKSRER